MEDDQLQIIDYEVDEFGRVIITDESIMEYVNGAGSFTVVALESNKACGSNGACGNAGCENLGC